MPNYTFVLNGQSVTVDAPPDMPMLWVLRDILGVTGPKYGCGVGVCRACTSHLNGAAFNPCVTPVADCAGARRASATRWPRMPRWAATTRSWSGSSCRCSTSDFATDLDLRGPAPHKTLNPVAEVCDSSDMALQRQTLRRWRTGRTALLDRSRTRACVIEEHVTSG